MRSVAAVMAMIAVLARAAVPTTAEGWYTPSEGFNFVGANATWTDRFGMRDGCTIDADGEIVWGATPADANVRNALEYALKSYRQSSINEERIRTIGENLNDLTSKTGIEISSEHDPSVKYRITFGGQTIAGAAAGADGGILEARTSQGSFADGASLTWTGPTVDGASHGLELAGWHDAQATLPTLAAAAQYGSNPYMLVAKAGNSVKYVDVGQIGMPTNIADGASIEERNGKLQLSDWLETPGSGTTLSEWLKSSGDDGNSFAGTLSDFSLVARNDSYGYLSYVPIGSSLGIEKIEGDGKTVDKEPSDGDDGGYEMRLHGIGTAAANQVPTKSGDDSIVWTDLPPTVEYEDTVLTITPPANEGPVQPQDVFLSDFSLTVEDGWMKFTWYSLDDPDEHTKNIDISALYSIDRVDITPPDNYASVTASIIQKDNDGNELSPVDYDVPYSAFSITGMSAGSLSGNQRTYNFTGTRHDGEAIETGTVTATITEPQTDITSLSLTTEGETAESTRIKASLTYVDKQGSSHTLNAPLTINKPISADQTVIVDNRSIDDRGVNPDVTTNNLALQIKGFSAGASCPGGHTLAQFARGEDTAGAEAAHKIMTRYQSGDAVSIHYLPIGDLPHPKVDGNSPMFKYSTDGGGKFELCGGTEGQYLKTDNRGAPVWGAGPADMEYSGGLTSDGTTVKIGTDGGSDGQVLTRSGDGVAWMDVPATGADTNAVRWTGSPIDGGAKVNTEMANFDFPANWAGGGLEKEHRAAVKGVMLAGWNEASAGQVPRVSGTGDAKTLTWGDVGGSLHVKGNDEGATYVTGTNIVFETMDDSDVRIEATVEDGIIHLKFGVHYK